MNTEDKVRFTVKISKDQMTYDDMISISVVRHDRIFQSALIQSPDIKGRVALKHLDNGDEVPPLLYISFKVAKAVSDAIVGYERHQQYPVVIHESYPGATNSFSNETISAFAYNTGRKIEELITKETNNLKQTSQTLSNKILQWYLNTKDEEFAKHFGIEIIHPVKTT